jgi:hypothetical protein
MTTLKVYGVTVDTDGIRFCETSSQVEADKTRAKWFTTKRKTCMVPSFLTPVLTDLTTISPDVFYIVTQDEDESNTYLHADLLPAQLNPMGYHLYFNMKAVNVGWFNPQDGIKDAHQLYPDLTDLPQGSALRMSVYVKRDQYDQWISYRKQLDVEYPIVKRIFDQSHHHGGALACHLRHPQFGTIVIVGCNFPYSSNLVQLELSSGVADDKRRMSRLITKVGLSEILNVFRVPSIDHFIIAGDFAADYSGKSDDDYITALKSPGDLLDDMTEGVNNGGPSFPPTYRYRRYYTDQTAPTQKGYPDRILTWDNKITKKGSNQWTKYGSIMASTGNHLGVVAALTYQID